ncbi:MAG: hypothetical protein Q7S23_01945 [bacterium]|nr:hypothetical protein [bacterium]
MLAPRRTSPGKLISLTLVLVVTIVTIGWLLYTNVVNTDTAVVPTQWQQEFADSAQVQYPPPPAFNAEPPVFTSRQFTELRQVVPLPVEAGPTGRTNPFEPLPYIGTTTPTTQ